MVGGGWGTPQRIGDPPSCDVGLTPFLPRGGPLRPETRPGVRSALSHHCDSSFSFLIWHGWLSGVPHPSPEAAPQALGGCAVGLDQRLAKALGPSARQASWLQSGWGGGDLRGLGCPSITGTQDGQCTLDTAVTPVGIRDPTDQTEACNLGQTATCEEGPSERRERWPRWSPARRPGASSTLTCGPWACGV